MSKALKKGSKNSNQNSVKINKDRLAYLEALEKEKELKELKDQLPHLYAHKRYPWQAEFLKETNRQCWVCAANQIGKSSAQIIKVIALATDPSLWKKYFNRRPTTFWYFYPKKSTATTEFHEKWVKEYLPRGNMKNHPKYGWKCDIRQKEIHSIQFNTGVTIYFMSYEMKPSNIQATTLDYCACDEEIPQELYSEISARLFATEGLFSCVFTATLGQEWVRKIIEGEGEDRIFPNSWRRQVSMYDCRFYDDGTPTKFTEEYIDRIKYSLPNDTEIQRRVFGKFVIAGGLVYPSFDSKVHYKDPHPLPKNWQIWAAVDIGSGGESSHPAAIAFIATNPEYTKGRVIDCWRGDNEETTASDILKKYRDMRGNRQITCACYDYAGAGKDFGIIADRMGEGFIKANKTNREHWIGTLNTLFKNNMLHIYKNNESRKLIEELITLKIETPKQKARDDLIDAVKYCISQIPWDFSCLNVPEPERKDKYKGMSERDKYIAMQKQGMDPEKRDRLIEEEINKQFQTVIGEIQEWNEYYEE